jgi:pyruvate-formate lyase-activating enzyme
MGKASRRKQERRARPPDGHLPDPAAPIERWLMDGPHTGRPRRAAHFWQVAGRRVRCDLCYRRCLLDPGETGWCGYRRHERGTLQLAPHAHGVVTCLVRQQRGYQVDPFLTYKPGATSLFVGGVHCTAGCVFCMSQHITWAPERVRWLGDTVGRLATDAPLYDRKAIMHPEGVVARALAWGCAQVEFGINEPLLSWEFTYDVARLAKEAGLDVVVETNGFSAPAAIEALAPYVDAVDVGVKGHLDPDFYERRMRSPGAPAAVKASILAWRQAGVHLLIGDLVPPPHWCDAETAEATAQRFYAWLAHAVDPHVPLLITQIMRPGPQQPRARLTHGGLLLPAGADAYDAEAYHARLWRALALARAEGLAYAHTKTDDPIRCHECGGVLVRFPDPCTACWPCTMPTHFCDIWEHEQHVTGGRCDHCGAAVPIVTLSAAELARTRAAVAETARQAVAERYIVLRTPRGEEWRPRPRAGLSGGAGAS